jgi:Recombinase
MSGRDQSESLVAIIRCAHADERALRDPLGVDASYHAIHQVLTNPVYAGAYVYGKTRTR